MKYIDFDESRELDLIPIGRVAIDFNPTDYYNTLDKCENYKSMSAVHLLTLLSVLQDLAKR